MAYINFLLWCSIVHATISIKKFHTTPFIFLEQQWKYYTSSFIHCFIIIYYSKHVLLYGTHQPNGYTVAHLSRNQDARYSSIMLPSRKSFLHRQITLFAVTRCGRKRHVLFKELFQIFILWLIVTSLTNWQKVSRGVNSLICRQFIPLFIPLQPKINLDKLILHLYVNHATILWRDQELNWNETVFSLFAIIFYWTLR